METEILTMPALRNTFDHVVVIVHTHSDDERGDLFITSKSDEYQTPLSATIEYVGNQLTLQRKANTISSFFRLSLAKPYATT